MAGEQTSSKECCVAGLKEHDKQNLHAAAAVATETQPGLASDDELEASML